MISEVDREDMRAQIKEFYKVWEEHGKPHPNSNDYLALNRAFFYAKGYERGCLYAILQTHTT